MLELSKSLYGDVNDTKFQENIVDNQSIARKLLSFSRWDVGQDLLMFNDNLRQIFLEMGSETPSNLSCLEHIEYGMVDRSEFGKKDLHGLKLRGKNTLLSEVMNAIENVELPSEVKEQFPDLTIDEWDATTRMITMVLLSLEYIP